MQKQITVIFLSNRGPNSPFENALNLTSGTEVSFLPGSLPRSDDACGNAALGGGGVDYDNPALQFPRPEIRGRHIIGRYRRAD